VTTIYPEDLPVVKAAMDSGLPPIPGAVLPLNFNAYAALQQAILPDKRRFTNVLETTTLFSRTRDPYIHVEDLRDPTIVELLNTTADHFTTQDALSWFLSPVSWRDVIAKEVATQFLKGHQMRMRVDLKKVLRNEKLLQVLEKACLAMSGEGKVSEPREMMMALETLHRSVILYMWMRQRLPVVFADYEEASDIKKRTEKAMEFVLRKMTKK
jgi:ATP-dependent RNA helicase SUPV3L1/SUV3